MSYTKIKISKYDKQWSLLVRGRDQRCLVCGKTENLAAHHYIRRGIKATRLMIENGITLCPACHVFSHQFSAHRTPEAFKRWFRSSFKKVARSVENKANQHVTERQAIQEFQALYFGITPANP